MINEIIDLINGGFDGIHADAIVLGLVQRVYRVNNSSGEIEYMPGVVKMDGEAIYAGIDDVKSLMIYHKTNNSNLSYAQRSGGYGDARQNEDSIFCSCIVVWDTRKIQLQNVDLLLLLRSRMPQEMRGINKTITASITPSSAILSTKQVFESEYSVDKEYLLPIYINFIQLNYTIAVRYEPECIQACIDCKKN